MRDTEGRSDWVFGLSLVQGMLLLVFAAMLIYVTENVEGRGQEFRHGVGEANVQDTGLQARLEAEVEKNSDLEKRLDDMSDFVDELKLMIGAKASVS